VPLASKINALRTRAGVPDTLIGSFQGTAQAYQQSLTTVPLLILAAIAAIYVIMGVLCYSAASARSRSAMRSAASSTPAE
jgi:multidrug efflux pump subunit AcrB